MIDGWIGDGREVIIVRTACSPCSNSRSLGGVAELDAGEGKGSHEEAAVSSMDLGFVVEAAKAGD